MRLGAVLEDREPKILSDLAYRSHVDRLPVQVHRKETASPLGHSAHQLAYVHQLRLQLNIDERRGCTDSVDRDDATAMCEQVLDQRRADSTGSPSDDDAQAIRLSADQRPPRPLGP